MAYTKRIPPIKMVFTKKEYNTLIGVLINNLKTEADVETIKIAKLTKDKMLNLCVPTLNDNNEVEIETRLFINEASDFISQLLFFASKKINETNYYELLLKQQNKY